MNFSNKKLLGIFLIGIFLFWLNYQFGVDFLFLIPFGTTTTFFPDDDPESSSMSAFVIANGSTNWDTEHDSTTADDILASFAEGTRAIEVGIGAANWTFAKFIALFDTGSTINGDTVDSAIFSIYSTGKQADDNDGNDFVGIVQVQAITSNTAVTDTDHDEVGNTIDNPTEGAPRIDISADWATTAYNDFTLDATGRGWIANTSGGKNPSGAPVAGITQLGAREGHDIVDDEMAAASRNFVRINGSGSAGTSTDPKLVVVHTAPVTTTSSSTSTSTSSSTSTSTSSSTSTSTSSTSTSTSSSSSSTTTTFSSSSSTSTSTTSSSSSTSTTSSSTTSTSSSTSSSTTSSSTSTSTSTTSSSTSTSTSTSTTSSTTSSTSSTSSSSSTSTSTTSTSTSSTSSTSTSSSSSSTTTQGPFLTPILEILPVNPILEIEDGAIELEIKRSRR